MPDIRIVGLPLATGPTAPAPSDVIPLDGSTTRKAPLSSVADAIRPIASQAEAEAGTNAVKGMSPLTTAQAITAQGSTQFASTSQGLLADTALQPSDIGTSAGTVAAGNDTRIVNANTLLTGMSTVTPYGIPFRRFTEVGFQSFLSTQDAQFPDFGPAAIHGRGDGKPSDGDNMNGVLGEIYQDNVPGDWSYPCGVIGYGKLNSAGNQVFGFFGRVDQVSYGVATHELNTFNFKEGPPGVFPPDRGFGIAKAIPITLTIAAGGTYQSLIGIQIGPEGSQPSSYVCGLYTNADGVTGYGYIIDASSTLGPTISGVLNNTGQGSNVHLQFQTKGTAVASNFVAQHLNAGGTRTWGITQDGSHYIGVDKILDNSAWTAFTPTVGATSGSITSYTATGKYKRIGRIVFVDVDVTITNNGTGAGQLTIGSIPVPPVGLGTYFSGREAGLGNKMVHGSMNNGGATITVFDYSGAYPAATNARILLSGRYEV